MQTTRYTCPRVAFAPVLALGVSACATASEPPTELVQARSAYNAATESEAWQYDRPGLNGASSALAKAETSYRKEGDSAATRKDAELALRRAQQAQFEGAVTARVHSDIDRAIAARLATEAQAEEDKTDSATSSETPAPRAVVTLAVALFPTGQSSLASDARDKLDLLAAELTGHPDASVRIRGHADATGSEQRNMELSRERANRVAEYLASLGVPSEQMVVDAVGDSQPLVSSQGAGADAINRRVQLVAYVPAERASETEVP